MYLTHLTKDGDRWDLIAWHYYRDFSQVSRILDANPHVPITETLTGGIRLSIPVVEVASETLEELPPWKQ